MSKPNIISFSNSKGGVGKTTSVINVGCALAQKGFKTLLIDLDHQGNLSDDLGRGDEEYTITDLFEDPKYDINKLIYPSLDQDRSIENLFIIPADITLAVEARSAERFRHRLSILSDAIDRIEMHLDYILIDLRPAIDLSVENAVLITDLIVIPVDQDKRAVKGIDDLLEVVKEVRRNESIPYCLVRTKINKSHTKMRSVINEKIAEGNYPVFETEIRVSECYKHATTEGRPTFLYAPTDKSHEDYTRLTDEILKKLEV